MKSRRILVIALATALLLGLAGGLSQAQGPGGEPLPPNTDLKQQEEAAGRAAQPDATLELTGDLGAGFYYQGTLTQAGVPVSGVRQMEFKLFNAASGGAQVGVTLTQNVTVTKGQFSTLLNWGSAQIQGQALWLHVRAKDSGGVWRDLGRRQILAVPYAMSLIPGASINAQSNTALYLQSAGSDALNVTSTSGDGIHTDGQWDGIHAVNHATYSGNGAVYARAEATTGGATGGNFGTYSEDGFGVAAYNSGTGVASLGFQSGYSPDDPTSYWRPGGLFGGRNGAMGITKEPGGYGLIGWSQVTTGYGEGIEARCDSPDCTAGYFSSAGNGVIISAGPARPAWRCMAAARARSSQPTPAAACSTPKSQPRCGSPTTASASSPMARPRSPSTRSSPKPSTWQNPTTSLCRPTVTLTST